MLHSNQRMMQSGELLDDITSVIEKPMMVFKLNGNEEFCYVRAVGWNTTMLLSVKETDDHLEVVACEIDPPH